MIESRIAEVLTERFQQDDLTDCFLVHVEQSKNNKIVVYVDSDDQLTIKKCQVISRYLENKIEESGWLPEKYTLDVSSPGTDNPLRLFRQYVKNIGRKAEILMNDDSTYRGLIEAASDGRVMVNDEKTGPTELDFENIIETKILVSFK